MRFRNMAHDMIDLSIDKMLSTMKKGTRAPVVNRALQFPNALSQRHVVRVALGLARKPILVVVRVCVRVLTLGRLGLIQKDEIQRRCGAQLDLSVGWSEERVKHSDSSFFLDIKQQYF